MPNTGPVDVKILEYPLLGGVPSSIVSPETAVDLTARVRELENHIEVKKKEFARDLETAKREATELGRRQAAGEQTAVRQQCVGQLKAALDEFRAARDQYIAQVEQEAVRLALAIAERVLLREAHLDPLFLSGAVRVALGQLAESTEVRLRVPASQKEMWAEMVRLMPALPLRPEVRADEALKECEAILETSLGEADLSLRAQLEEIERSFFEARESNPPQVNGSGASAGGRKQE
jgi:flagellar assembly protein FliH